MQHLGQQVAREGVGDGGELLLFAPVGPVADARVAVAVEVEVAMQRKRWR